MSTPTLIAPTPAATPLPAGVPELVVLGDSTAAGLGDPRPGGGWRGFGPLLAAALGTPGYTNLAVPGARVRCVIERQLPTALRTCPAVAATVAGMNDTMRADFDPVRLHDDLDALVGALRAGGCLPLTTRFHDHSRVFRLPGPLRRALSRRIETLNAAVDAVSARHGAPCLDLAALPGVYDPLVWSVDRLHPSERGHRMLARGFATLLAGAGLAVGDPVAVDVTDGRRLSRLDRAGWLAFEGVPWLWRRGRDLLPAAVSRLAANRG